MSRLQVDPKLFVTCRLCLEDTGQYQIDPTVQKQIKYCYDIHVDSYDGLPQLICQKCERQLSEFYKIKENYVQKQHKLKSASSPKDSIQPQQDDVSSSQFNESDNVEQTQNKRIPKRNRIVSSSSSDSEEPIEKKNKKQTISSQQSNSSEYKTKKFGCRLCHCYFAKKDDVLTHLRNCHERVKTKFKHIFQKHCTVKLIKQDKMPNPTGIRNTVEISDKKIIEGINPNYYVQFSTCEDSDIKEDQEELKCSLSKISHCTEYPILVNDNEGKMNDQNDVDEVCSEQELKRECIDIEDTSSEDSNVGKMVILRKTRVKNTTSTEDINKTIQSIINICQSRYKNRKSAPDNSARSKSPDIEYQLKRKVLNIGRKMLRKQGFKCTGLLRYLEHKNLEILWFQKTYSDSEPNSNVIHINTKLKCDKVDHSAGWAPFYQSKQGPQSSKIISETPPMSEEDTKLLNPNPVPNPKQLPKKNISFEKQTHDSTNKIKKTYSKGSTSKKCIPQMEEESFTLPVITSTTSLAQSEEVPISAAENKLKVPNSPVLDMEFVPKIRVKSDSELMSEKVLMNRNQIQNIYQQDVNDNKLQTQSTQKITQSSNTKLTIQQAEPSTAVSSTSIEYVILDTVDLPNTKTESPFDYIRKLLNIYNIILLETTENLSQEYVCLIKFKVCFKQEMKDSVILCLSLYCKKNCFCIKVQDKKQEHVDIDVSKISPVWQWEIIKVFRGNIDNKMLNNAQKVGQQVYEYVESFLSLLRSIKYEKPS